MKLLCFALVVLVVDALPTHNRFPEGSESARPLADFGTEARGAPSVRHNSQKRRDLDAVVKHLCAVVLEGELSALVEAANSQSAEDGSKEACVDCQETPRREESVFVKFCRDVITDMELAELQ